MLRLYTCRRSTVKPSFSSFLVAAAMLRPKRLGTRTCLPTCTSRDGALKEVDGTFFR